MNRFYNYTRPVLPVLCLLLNQCIVYAQDNFFNAQGTARSDTGLYRPAAACCSGKPLLPAKSLIVPGVLIGYGFSSLHGHEQLEANAEVKEELWAEHPHALMHLDNYLQFTPLLSVFALDAAGIKAKHSTKERVIVTLLSHGILNAIVYPLKKITKEQRPDGSNLNSFPSGHTAEAFAGGEMLRQEYNYRSPVYGIAGYALAAGTGFLRMYNNKHWLGDVVAGAGTGILATRLAYWLYPVAEHLLSGKNHGDRNGLHSCCVY